jgi:hypothetical protein
MKEQWSRRHLLKQLAAVSATLVLPTERSVAESVAEGADQNYEVQISSVSAQTA